MWLVLFFPPRGCIAPVIVYWSSHEVASADSSHALEMSVAPRPAAPI